MRQVYFDPFGSYQSGYDAGTAREGQTQAATRVARQEDFNYNYKEPLNLAKMQRADTLGQAALPYEVNNLGYSDQLAKDAVFNSGMNIHNGYAQVTGNGAPGINAYNAYEGVYTAPMQGSPNAPAGQQPAQFDPNNTGSLLAEHGYTHQQIAMMHPEQAQTLAEVFHHSKQLTADEQAGVNAQESRQFGVRQQDQLTPEQARSVALQEAQQFGPQSSQYNIPRATAPVALEHPSGTVGYYDNRTGQLQSVQNNPSAAFVANANYSRSIDAQKMQWEMQKEAAMLRQQAQDAIVKQNYNLALENQTAAKLQGGNGIYW